jgi:membrane-bound serine protease (ClpP class)
MKTRGIVRTGFALCAVVLLSSTAIAGNVLRLTLDGSINPASRDLVLRAIAQAESGAAELLLIELDTPGGLEQSMRDIVTAELASEVPIVVFVAPSGARAASAGVFLTMAADVAAMAPGTNIGAAHPVNLIGGDTADGEQNASIDKAANDAAAFARSIAEQRGRNAEWAESAVLLSSALSAEEALKQGVIDLVAGDTADLLERLEGYALDDRRVLHTRGASIEEIRPTLRERLLGLLADPNLVYVLFILGLYGLIYEFFHPGIGFGLAAGGVCLLLALFGLQVLPVNVTGIALILFGMALIVLDAFTPTNGILTVGGVVGLLAGSVTLFDIPDRSIGLSWGTIAAVIGVTTAFSVFVLSKGLMIQRKPPATGITGLVGTTGTARTQLDPDGRVFVHGEYWTARSVDGPIAAGAHIVVQSVDRGTLIVRRSG